MSGIPRILGYITPVRAFSSAQGVYMQAASGRVADALAKHFDKVYVCARVVHGPPLADGDLPFEASNIELIEQPFWRTSAGSLHHFFGIARAYLATCRRADVLFVRGMCPYISVLYLLAFLFRRPICHWIVGDPVALLQTSGRNGTLLDIFALIYALQDRMFTRIGRWLTGGALLCNGRELASGYRSPRTTAVVSSTVHEKEFFTRTDTCLGETVRILFVGYIRPEKGIEFLLYAVNQLTSGIPWELEIVGSDEFPDYRRRLDALVAARGIQKRVRWTGYMPYGKPLFDRMHAADIFVLPTLSEGTPHVLVEARANSLPCISTTVGGVPSTVKHGYDGWLVPPKDASALAGAIERVVRDGELRRTLIRNGLEAAHQQTLERFVATILRELEPNLEATKEAVQQEKEVKKMRVLKYLWFHFVMMATAWLPDLRPILRVRGFLLRPAFKKCGGNLQVARRVTINFPNRLEIGQNVFIAAGCWLHARGGIALEDEVQLGPYAVLVTGDHTREHGSYRDGRSALGPIRLCHGSWLAAHATVTRGVMVGRGAVIAANSVATRNVPEFTVAGGVPARIVSRKARMEVVV